MQIVFASLLAALSQSSLAENETAALLARIAKLQIGVTTSYHPGYQKLDYPGGDVPKDRGVCTDVVVRAFRELGIDLQKLVHEDMTKNFANYPKNWGLKKPDRNIDHRRVPNLVTFFKTIASPHKGKDVLPGDVVIWDLGKSVLHIGIVSNTKKGADYLVVHNICCGAQEEDILHSYKKVEWFRFNEEAFKRLKAL